MRLQYYNTSINNNSILVQEAFLVEWNGRRSSMVIAADVIDAAPPGGYMRGPIRGRLSDQPDSATCRCDG